MIKPKTEILSVRSACDYVERMQREADNGEDRIWSAHIVLDPAYNQLTVFVQCESGARWDVWIQDGKHYGEF